VSRRSRSASKAKAASAPPLRGSFFARRSVLVAILVAVGFAAYSGSFRGPFVFDDLDIVPGNPTIRTLAGSLFPPAADGATVSGRPLVNFSLAVNYAIGGLDVTGYHVTNLAIHLAAVLVLFGFMRRLLDRLWRVKAGHERRREARFLAFAIALVWMLHPLQTEAVTYLAQRAELMASLFYLLTLYFFLRAVESPGRKRWTLFAVGSCLAGMASKEVMASAPVMVLLLDRVLISESFASAWRRRRGLYLGLFSSWVLLAWLVVGTAGRGGTAGFSSGVSVPDYLMTQCWAIIHYIRLAIWPYPLVFDYGIELRTGPGEWILPAILLVGLFAAVAMAIRKKPMVGLAGLFFFAVLAPSSSFVPVATQTVAEHRMYLPLAALVALAMVGMESRIGRRVLFVAIAWAAALGVATAFRNLAYRSEYSIWADTVAKMPGNGRAHANLGKALSELGREDEAVVELDEAIRLRPDLASAHYNLGLIHYEAGDSEAARAEYEQALFYDPHYPDALLNLAVILTENGQLTDAIPLLEEAIQEAPAQPESRVVLGNIFAQLGRLDDAVAQHEEALRLAPDSANAHFNYGHDLFQLRRLNDAEVQYRMTVAADPGNFEAHYYLGITLLGLGRGPEGVAELNRALEINPDFEPARATLDQFRRSQGAGSVGAP